jgi:hypothetical protein
MECFVLRNKPLIDKFSCIYTSVKVKIHTKTNQFQLVHNFKLFGIFTKIFALYIKVMYIYVDNLLHFILRISKFERLLISV